MSLTEMQSIVNYQSSRLRSIMRTYLEGEQTRSAESNKEFMKGFYQELEVCGTWIAVASLKYEGLIQAPPCYKECMLVVVNNGTMVREAWVDAISGTSGAPDGYLDRYERAWWKDGLSAVSPIQDVSDSVAVWKAQSPNMCRALEPLPPPVTSLESLSQERLHSARAVARDLRALIVKEVAERVARIKDLQARIIHITMERNRVEALEVEYQRNQALGKD
ncbi:hypothetical protein CC1G_14781 [Coprinopsis cinerea okayama7|uniref:Uncharacterized protein n=1 Tax=Coprinopsis cinerea (strain Okayama-7 / 130 / ATCC MYA-4618 / FGSC 9003) TaxID=240176 RepID=D6RNU1_COPC7|nr:hypothetical protein CC1G_14781 [Coprinopsis cinerea okayama7\|eukprot:XP_002910803.1 hypothetical protein CC1G_14781 [Coprinopsis cinerea okayama7\